MKVGDRVVCIKSSIDPENPRVKDKIYTIIDVDVCPKCGAISFDIGIALPIDSDGVDCDCGYGVDCIIWWQYAKHFAPIKYNLAHDELINIVEERIDVKQPIEATS